MVLHSATQNFVRHLILLAFIVFALGGVVGVLFNGCNHG